jgi:uridine kinase
MAVYWLCYTNHPMPTSPSHSYIIGLAGGSAAGKSTFAEALLAALLCGTPPLSATLVSTDAYFLPDERIPRFHSPSTGLDTPDYNRPDSIDAGQLLSDIAALAAALEHPHVLLVEGLMVLYREDIRQILDLRLFLELEGEVRALRRLVRNLGGEFDPINKNDPASTANYYLESAWVGHGKYVEPSRRYADLILRGDGDFTRTAGMVADVVRKEFVHR